VIIGEVFKYQDSQGYTDGTYGIEIIFPAGSNVSDVDFQLTEGFGVWEFFDGDLYDGEDDEGIYYSNYFFPSCSGDFSVIVTYSLNGASEAEVTSTTIEEPSLGTCDDFTSSSSNGTISSSSLVVDDVPFLPQNSVTLGAQNAMEKSGIDLDTWVLHSLATELSPDIDLVFGNVDGGPSLMIASEAKSSGLGVWGSVVPNDAVFMFVLDMTPTDYNALENLSDLDPDLVDINNYVESVVVEVGMILLVVTSETSNTINLVMIESVEGFGNSASVTISGLVADQSFE